jgi:hypothetical protein
MADEPEEKPEPSITGAAFWALMDRWGVPDELALPLIAGPPRTATGKRPRFRLLGEQVARFELLRAIDQHLVDLHRDPAPWLAKANPAKPFARRKPIAFMAEGGSGAIADTLRFLERQAFKASLERSIEAARPQR